MQSYCHSLLLSLLFSLAVRLPFLSVDGPFFGLSIFCAGARGALAALASAGFAWSSRFHHGPVMLLKLARLVRLVVLALLCHFESFCACSSTVLSIGPLPLPVVPTTWAWPVEPIPSPASGAGAGAALSERSTPEEFGC